MQQVDGARVAEGRVLRPARHEQIVDAVAVDVAGAAKRGRRLVRSGLALEHRVGVAQVEGAADGAPEEVGRAAPAVVQLGADEDVRVPVAV
ncbi:MAG: hypothetical protein ACK559_33515, partial [bacterium]